MPANPIRDLLCRAALAIALTAAGAMTALADPPGYYFQDSWQPKQEELQATSPAVTSTAPNNSGSADANKAAAAAKVDNSPCSCSSSGHSAGK
jgi:hypothetical protein